MIAPPAIPPRSQALLSPGSDTSPPGDSFWAAISTGGAWKANCISVSEALAHNARAIFIGASAYVSLSLVREPRKAEAVKDFTRDVRKIGHWGTGDLELTLRELSDLDRAKPLIQRAYEGGPSAS